MGINSNAENASKFSCNICNFKCSKQSDFNRHLSTAKHSKMVKGINNTQNNYSCSCGNVYKHSSGLYRHKRQCTINTQDILTDPIPQTPPVDMTMVFELLKQNQEFKDLMMEQAKQLAQQQHENTLLLAQQNQRLIEHQEKSDQQHLQQNQFIIEAVKDGKLGNTTNNNTTNNKFNLNVFLNETCKDAITMNEFVNSIEVSMEDFVETGKLGFVDGISKVIMERMQGMEMHTRPMHCTDLKRETLYIKNDDAWEKGDQDKTLLRRAVKNVATKNYRQLKPWYESAQPQVDQNGTEEYEDYFQYYKAALGGCGKDEDKKFEDKIMRNIIKRVVVDKDTIAM
jgi:hypothetical protein